MTSSISSTHAVQLIDATTPFAREKIDAPSTLAGEKIVAPSPLAGEGWGEGEGRRAPHLTKTHPIVFARSLRRNQTDAEKFLWKHLRNHQLEGYKFKRQQPIEQYTVDFICFERSLIIELDGGQHAEQRAYDERRAQVLKLNSYEVLRFWNNDVLINIEGVLSVIRERLIGR